MLLSKMILNKGKKGKEKAKIKYLDILIVHFIMLLMISEFQIISRGVPCLQNILVRVN